MRCSSSITGWGLMLTLSSSALANPPSPPTSAPQDAALGADTKLSDTLLARIDGMQRLPLNGLHMVRSGDKTFFLSDNGRYVLLGTLVDLWTTTTLRTLADLEHSLHFLNRDKLKLDVADLGALDWGTGDKEVWVFFDPHAPACISLFEQLRALKPNELSEYRFRLIPLAVLGEASIETVVRLNCQVERNRPRATEQALKAQWDALAPASGTCGQGPLQRATVTAHLLGLDAVPYLVAPDGRIHSGPPAQLLRWLADAPASSTPTIKGVTPP